MLSHGDCDAVKCEVDWPHESANSHFTKAALPTAAAVRGSQSSVAPRRMLLARSPRCGGPSNLTTSGPYSRGALPPVRRQIPGSAQGVCTARVK